MKNDVFTSYISLTLLVTVTLSKTATTPMKGFLIQARRIDPGTDQDTPVGTFSVTDSSTTQTTCTTTFVSK